MQRVINNDCRSHRKASPRMLVSPQTATSFSCLQWCHKLPGEAQGAACSGRQPPEFLEKGRKTLWFTRTPTAALQDVAPRGF